MKNYFYIQGDGVITAECDIYRRLTHRKVYREENFCLHNFEMDGKYYPRAIFWRSRNVNTLNYRIHYH